MERLFETLGQPLCLLITERLVLGPAETQENLRKELGADKKTMSDSVKRLMDAKLVGRERARGPCVLLRRERIHELLQLAANLESEIADEQAERATKRARELRKASLQATGNQGQTKAAS